MNIKHKFIRLTALGIAVISALGLAACSNDATGSKPVHLSNSYQAAKPATKAGDHSTLKVAEIADSPFAGISAPTMQSMGEDQDMYSPGGSGTLFNSNKNYKIVNGGLANLKLNKSANEAIITLRKNAKWSNGQKVTAKDIEYPYEILANKNSHSQQFNGDMDDIKGISAYHDGKSSRISGITFPDGSSGRTAVLHYKYLPPAIKYVGNDFMWDSVEPYHYIKNVPISKLQSSSQVRKRPIFVGPYKLKKQIQGETTSWVPNKYYYGKAPNIKRIDLQVVSPSNFTAALKSKKYDFTLGAPSSEYPRVKGLKDYSEVGSPSLGYSFIGFNLGYINNSGKNVMYKNTKMKNRNLRKAMLYALNTKMVAKKFGNGLSYQGNTLIPPAFKQYHDNNLRGYQYNMSKARQLLKQAGYTKHGGKYITKPNGKKLVIHFGTPSGSATINAKAHYYLQQWQKLGLDVKFTDGRPMEMNNFYSNFDKPKQNAMDVFLGSIGVGSEPTPGAFGLTSDYNAPHFATRENTKLMSEMNSKKAFSKSYRIKIFKKWQKYMNKEAAVVPEFYSMEWEPVNHRVTGYSLSPADNDFWGKLGLNSATRE